MLNGNDESHLRLLYDKLVKANLHIKRLVEQGDIESADIAVQEKDALIKKILAFEKSRIDDIKQNENLLALRNEIVELEKSNIILIETMKDNLRRELGAVKQAKRVLNTYEPQTNIATSTFDVIQDD